MKADALVLFGATGDLAKKKLFPALYDLEDLGELDVKIFGVASSKWTQDVFRDNVEAAIRARKPEADEEVVMKIRNEVLSGTWEALSSGHADLALGVWVLKKHKTAKKTGKPLLVTSWPSALTWKPPLRV